MKTNPIIAVKNIEASRNWYTQLLQCKGKHGGDEFEVLVNSNDEVLLCLHLWGEHQHPTMMNAKDAGNGLILYIRVENIDGHYQVAQKLKLNIDKPLSVNSNSGMSEFALWDVDGYYVILSSMHNF